MKRQSKQLIRSLIHTAQRTVERYAMISPEDSLLVGISGGADSVALLLFLIDISNSITLNNYPAQPYLLESPQYSPIRIGVAHINHSLRGAESDRDENFVINLAKKYSLPCYTIKVDVPDFAKENKLSFEEAAREIRYSFYREIAYKENYSKIALGHNSDDNAELVLMNLLRGSGTKGIAGILPVRDIHHISSKICPASSPSPHKEMGNGKTPFKIIRPLIEISKEEILEYLKLKEQAYVFDSSNNDTTYLRNKIRHLLIPHLKENYNPSITQSLNRLSTIIMEENSWMEEETEKIFNNSLIEIEKRVSGEKELVEEKELAKESQKDEVNKRIDNIEEVQLNSRALKNMHIALAKRVIRRAIKEVKGELRRVSFQHIDDILKLIRSQSGGKAIHLPDKIRVIKIKNCICFRKESRPLREIGNEYDQR
ncbi:MAG: tRNA lysidine(34) synthetase TilS [Desulfamplus sp.]|nr:tRNA lysidine(34) synthetase TilS [Desulfamplus sp.]